MRFSVLSALGLACVVGAGCTTPQWSSFGAAATPKFKGPESTRDQLHGDEAHRWTDDDARTALWYARNFPDDLASFGFLVHKFVSFNMRDDRFGAPYDVRNDSTWYYTHTSVDRGYRFSGIFNARSDEWFPMLNDPQLQVKMLSLEARERNRMRERDRRRRTGEHPFTSESRGDVPASALGPDEVEQRLLEIYQ